MRALLASLLLVAVLLPAAASHGHVEPPGNEPCSVCLARAPAVAEDAQPDVAPRAVVAGPAPLVPGLPPVTGAPLGAIPGQSPPRA